MIKHLARKTLQKTGDKKDNYDNVAKYKVDFLFCQIDKLVRSKALMVRMVARLANVADMAAF